MFEVTTHEAPSLVGEIHHAERPTKSYGSTAVRLRAQGYHPIPARGKKPMGKGWQHAPSWADEQVKEVSQKYPNANVGLVLGEDLLAIDIDAQDPTLADRLERLTLALLPNGPLLVRTGRHPRKLILVRTAQPFLKKRIGQVDLLTGGAQFIAFGVHPDTQRPYRWRDRSPLDTPRSDLPILSSFEIDLLMDLLALVQGPGSQHRDTPMPAADGIRAPRAPRADTQSHRSEGAKPEPFCLGRRNDDVFAQVKDYARNNPDRDDLEEVAAHFGERCEPPLPRKETDNIAASIRRYRDRYELFPKGVQYVCLIDQAWGRIARLDPRDRPRALFLYMLLRFTRRELAEFTIPQCATAKRLCWSKDSIRKTIGDLVSAELIIKLDQCRPSGPGKRPASLYRFTRPTTPTRCPVNSIPDSGPMPPVNQAEDDELTGQFATSSSAAAYQQLDRDLDAPRRTPRGADA